MQLDNVKKDGSQREVVFNLTHEEYGKLKIQAAINLSLNHKIPGFREGKAPYEVVLKNLGQEALQEEELMLGVKKYFFTYVQDNDLQVVGKPKVEANKIKPFGFSVNFQLLPEVDLGKWEKIQVTKHPVSVSQTEKDRVLNDLRESRASEALVNRGAQITDRVVIDFTVSVDGVVIEGGQAKDYSVILGKTQLIPGFEDNLIGLKQGETKKFELNFPQDYKKGLAGKKATVEAKISSVYERIIPELTDDFAKSIGKFFSLADLQSKLGENMQTEANTTEEERLEREMFDEFIKVATFTELPEVLLTNEVDRMINEFGHSIEHQGVEFEQYLKTLNKTKEQLKQEFATPAAKRVKVALIIRKLSELHNLIATDEVIDEEINTTLTYLSDSDKVRSYYESADYRDYVKNILTNRLVVEWLKNKLVVNS